MTNIRIVGKDSLPENNEYVLIYVRNRPWSDDDDIDNKRFWKVAKFVRGISQEERAVLKTSINCRDIARSKIVKPSDEDSNNKVPYYWEEFGPGTYFGQEVKYWMPLLSEDEILFEVTHYN